MWPDCFQNTSTTITSRSNQLLKSWEWQVWKSRRVGPDDENKVIQTKIARLFSKNIDVECWNKRSTVTKRACVSIESYFPSHLWALRGHYSRLHLNVTRDADTCSNWVSNVAGLVIEHLKFNRPWRELSCWKSNTRDSRNIGDWRHH